MTRIISSRAAAIAAMILALPVTARAAEGMPQLAFDNPLTISQIVWMALIFLALYLLLSNWALPKVTSVLAEREASIDGDLEAARNAKAQSDASVAEVHASTAKARAEAQAAISAAVEQAKAAGAQQSAALNERLEAQLRDAEARINAARAAAVGALHEVATDTATNLVTRLTGQPADIDAISGAVGNALAARAKA